MIRRTAEREVRQLFEGDTVLTRNYGRKTSGCLELFRLFQDLAIIL